jgi:hypothetical protein
VKKVLRKTPVKELAAIVSTVLKKHGINAVLTGGACVTIFSMNEYQSYDLDFVSFSVEYEPKKVTEAMREIGFNLTSQGHYENQRSQYIVEFIPPPLSIGSEPVKRTVELRTRGGTLTLLSPTDCVKDRLAAYYHWNDPQSLEQALMVARKQKIDLGEVRRWSKVEGHIEKFEDFIDRLKQRKGKKG